MFPDIPSLVVGLVVGGVVVGIVIEVMGRGRHVERPAAKLTTSWRLTELTDPVVVAREVADVEVPRGAKVYASGTVDPAVQARADVFQVPTVRAEFAVDGSGTRAFLFLGGLRQGSMALLTVEPETVQRLAGEARMLHDRGGAYVERRSIRELAGREGTVVETEGLVQDVLPFRQRFMIRLVDGDETIAVLVDKDPAELRDERILVRGRLERDGGYATIEALDIRTIR